MKAIVTISVDDNIELLYRLRNKKYFSQVVRGNRTVNLTEMPYKIVFTYTNINLASNNILWLADAPLEHIFKSEAAKQEFLKLRELINITVEVFDE